MPEPERNLVIVHTPRKQALEDFLAVKAVMAERAPDIEVIIVENGQRHSVTRRRASERPTLIFSPVALRTFRPMRGKVYADRRHTKSAEQARLAAGGVPVPRSALLTPDLVLDETWGDFVVIKPDSFSLQGRGVRLVRRSDVRWTDPESLPAADPQHGRPLRVESFIDTGAHAESHRVMTVFGRPVYCLTSHALEARPQLDPGAPVDLPIASNAGERTLALNFDRDIIALGCRAAAVFPEIPVLGVDVIREAATGKLFVLEVNTGVHTWHISSTYFAPYREKFGLDLHAQFGAIDVIADALIEVTRREAE